MCHVSISYLFYYNDLALSLTISPIMHSTESYTSSPLQMTSSSPDTMPHPWHMLFPPPLLILKELAQRCLLIL